MPHPLNLSDAELISRLSYTEDSFVERKSKSDRPGWLRTVVAFANSTPVGLPAILFIGVDDAGQIAPDVDTEKTMQAFSDYVDAHAWPPIYKFPRTLVHAGKSCVAVLVPGSAERPHFAGRAFVRVGTQTKDASEAQFSELIASRNSKVRELLAWKNREIGLFERHRATNHVGAYHDIPRDGPVVVHSCNQHFVTFVEKASITRTFSESLYRIEIGFDHRSGGRLQVFMYMDR